MRLWNQNSLEMASRDNCFSSCENLNMLLNFYVLLSISVNRDNNNDDDGDHNHDKTLDKG